MKTFQVKKEYGFRSHVAWFLFEVMHYVTFLIALLAGLYFMSWLVAIAIVVVGCGVGIYISKVVEGGRNQQVKK